MLQVNLTARIHDEARVASVKLSLKPLQGLMVLCAQVSEQLRIAVKWAEERDAVVGHIKAYLQWAPDAAVMLSTTGSPVETKGSPLPAGEPESVEIGVTGILFGVDLEEAEDRLRDIAACLAGQNGEWCAYTHDCEHEHHHHHDHDEHDHEHEHHHGHDHDHDHHGHAHHDHAHENG